MSPSNSKLKDLSSSMVNDDKDFYNDLRSQTDANTFHLASIATEIIDIKKNQQQTVKDHSDTKILLNQCANDIIWLKKIFWALLAFSALTFITTLSKTFLFSLQK